jgi:hypothetical protein
MVPMQTQMPGWVTYEVRFGQWETFGGCFISRMIGSNSDVFSVEHRVF